MECMAGEKTGTVPEELDYTLSPTPQAKPCQAVHRIDEYWRRGTTPELSQSLQTSRTVSHTPVTQKISQAPVAYQH
jgi:hypothetical protein